MVLFILIFNNDVHSQSSLQQKKPVSITDDLLQRLEKAKQDTARVNILSQLVEYLRTNNRYTEIPSYADQLLSICDKNLLLPHDINSQYKFRVAKAKAYNGLGSFYGFKNNYPEYLKYQFKAADIQKEINAKTDLWETYRRIGNGYANTRDFDRALQYYSLQLNLANELNDKRMIIQAYQYLALNYKRMARLSDALKIQLTALKLCDEISDKRLTVSVHMDLGNIYLNQGNYSASVSHHLASVKLSETVLEEKLLPDSQKLANCYHNLSNIYGILTNFTSALEYSFKALKLRELTGDQKGLSSEYGAIADIFLVMNKPDDALRYAEMAIDKMKPFNDKSFLAYYYFTVSEVYRIQNNYKEALKNMLIVRDYREEIKAKRELIYTYIKLAILNTELKDHRNIFASFNKALATSQEIGDRAAIAYTKLSWGKVYLNFPDSLDKAQKYLDDAVKDCKEIGKKDFLREAYDYLTQLHYKKKNFKEAFDNYKAFIIYQDSIINRENAEKIVRLQMQYEFEKKEAVAKLEEEKRLSEQRLQFEKEKALQALALSKQVSLGREQTLLAKQREDELKLLNQAKFIQDLELEKNKNTVKQQDLLLLAKNKDLQLLNKDKALQAALIDKEQSNRNLLLAGFGILLIIGGGTFYSYNQKRKLSFSKQVSEVELKALRAQMNPHFIFNSLSSIHNLIQANNQKAASAYLLQFSKLTRVVLENSSKQYTSLAEELEALKLYLDLENLRMDKKLSYQLNVDPGIDQENTLIPPFILQPFLENAILHGLRHKDDGGKISIDIARPNGMLKCVIADNGIGIQRSKEISMGSFAAKKESLGMKIVEQRISLINKMKKSKAYVAVNDRRDEMGDPAGVEVEIVLPIEQRF